MERGKQKQTQIYNNTIINAIRTPHHRSELRLGGFRGEVRDGNFRFEIVFLLRTTAGGGGVKCHGSRFQVFRYHLAN